MNALAEITQGLANQYNKYGTTFISKDDGSRYTVEIGDSKQAEFYPQEKLICSPVFENEFNYSIRLAKDPRGAQVSYDQEKIIQTFPDGTIARFYSLGDAYEFDVWLPFRPPNDVVPFTCRSKGLVFWRQRTLNNIAEDGSSWEWNEYGGKDRRPANVNESLAVYFADGQCHNAYKAGKAFHLFRPLAVDARGRSFWCDWVLDERNIPASIRIPTAAVYPVLLDPTLGITTGTGLSESEVPEGFISTSSFTPFTMPEDGIGVDFNLYMNAPNGDTEVTFGIYLGTGDTPAGNSRVSQSAGATVTVASGEGFKTQSIGGSLTSGSKYYLCWNSNIPTASIYKIYFDSNNPDSNGYFFATSAYSAGSLVTPFPTSEGNASGSKRISAYINYSTSAPVVNNTRRSQFMVFFPPTTR